MGAFDVKEERQPFVIVPGRLPCTFHGVVRISITSIGAGVKQTAKIAAVPMATHCRRRSSGTCSSVVRGWRGPKNTIMATTRAAQTVQLNEKNASPMMLAAVTNVIMVDRGPTTA